MLGFELADQFAVFVIREKGRLIIEIDGGAGTGSVPTVFVVIQFTSDAVAGPAIEDYFGFVPESIDAGFIGHGGDIEVDKVMFGVVDRHGGKIGILD